MAKECSQRKTSTQRRRSHDTGCHVVWLTRWTIKTKWSEDVLKHSLCWNEKHAFTISSQICFTFLSLTLSVSLRLSVCPQFSHLEPVLSSGMQSAGESYKAERWLLHSLQVHKLSAQLRPLLRHLGHTRKYYNGELSSLIRKKLL